MNNHPFGPWATAPSAPGEARLSTFWSRRMAMLPQLGGSRPSLSRRGRFGLIMLAMLGFALPMLRGTSAAPQDGGNREVSQKAGKEPANLDDDQRALKEFLDVYLLEPVQNLKRVPPPRPEGIRAWMKRQRPGMDDNLDEVRAMTFLWRDPDHLTWWASFYGSEATAGYSLRDLPRWTKMDISPIEIEGDPDLLKTQVSGDWIVREGVPTDQLVNALQTILQRALRQRITMIFRQVEARRGRGARPVSLFAHAGPIQQ